MLIGWVELIRASFSRRPTNSISVDAHHFPNNPKTYEMITSPTPRTADTMTKEPKVEIASPPTKAEGGRLSPLVQSPRPTSSQYTNSVDYFGKDFGDLSNPSFGQEALYKSPKLSFSTPRPPSAGGPLSSHGHDSFSSRTEPFASPGRHHPSAHTYSNVPPGREYRTRPFSQGYEWDPAATHAKPSQRQDSFGP